MESEEVDCDTIPEFVQDRNLVLVEYPGVVKNPEKVVKTLGGLKNISRTYSEENRRLDLRFRPDDPCCHTTCADRTPITAFLLKVKKYRKKKKPGDGGPDVFRYRPEISGIVTTAYRFSSLCDFQYLPLYNDVENDKLVNMLPHLGVGTKKFEDSLFTKDTPLFLPPAMFSRFDSQQDALFQKDPKYRLPEEERQPDKIAVVRPRRAHHAQYIKYEDDRTPEEPQPSAVEAFEKFVDKETSMTEVVKKLFEDRPIWSKNAIGFQLNCIHDDLKHILPMFAYYFITGPWRSLWVRLGYDPRKDKESAKYQLLDFRVRQGLNAPSIPIKAKRSTLQYKLPNLMPRSRNHTHAVEDIVAKMADTLGSSTGTPISDAIYIFRPGVLPLYRQTFYQLCDIKHPDVERIVESRCNNATQRGECHPKFGWLPDETAAEVRDLLTSDIQMTIAQSRLSKPPAKVGKLISKNKRLSKAHLEQCRKEFYESFSEDDSDPGPSSQEGGEESEIAEDEADDQAKQDDNDDDDDDDVILESVDEGREGGLADLETFSARVLDIFPEISGADAAVAEDADEMADFLDDFDAYSPAGLEVEFPQDDT